MHSAALLVGSAVVAAPAAPAFTLTSCTSTNLKCPRSTCSLFSSKSLPHRLCRSSTTRAQQQDQDYVAYDEKKSVFPAEACEELGGDACEVDGVGPEVKGSTSMPKPQASPQTASGPDREYVDYKENKTVFPGEACDDLGGEFCEPEYQAGVFPEKASAKK